MKIKIFDAYGCVSDPDYIMAAYIAVMDEDGNDHMVVSCPQGYDIKISRTFIEKLQKD